MYADGDGTAYGTGIHDGGGDQYTQHRYYDNDRGRGYNRGRGRARGDYNYSGRGRYDNNRNDDGYGTNTRGYYRNYNNNRGGNGGAYRGRDDRNGYYRTPNEIQPRMVPQGQWQQPLPGVGAMPPMSDTMPAMDGMHMPPPDPYQMAYMMQAVYYPGYAPGPGLPPGGPMPMALPRQPVYAAPNQVSAPNQMSEIPLDRPQLSRPGQAVFAVDVECAATGNGHNDRTVICVGIVNGAEEQGTCIDAVV